MNLTERERTILQLAKQGLSDYKIARRISMDPPNVTRSRKNAYRKLLEALTDIEWASQIDVNLYQTSSDAANHATNLYSFFL